MPSRVSNRLGAIPDSGLLRFFDILNSMDDVLSLGIGEPDLATPTPVCDAAIDSIRQGRTGYTSNAGILELRQEIAAHLERRYQVSYDPDDEILVTVGVSEALHAAILAMVDPGDDVLVPEPCFVSYVPCVSLASANPVPVATRPEEQFELTLERLEAAVTPKTRLLMFGYPNNPTGAVMSREHMLQVAGFAEKHDLMVISDEIYDRFVYGVEHTCFASLPGMQERTILLGGFSKSYAMTGWRIGFACGPAEVLHAMCKVHQFIIMSAPTAAQVGVLEGMLCEDDLTEEITQTFRARRDMVVSGLESIGLPCVAPRGAIYAFPSIAHTGLTSFQFSEQLLRQQKLAMVPGDAFGPSGEGHVRLAYTVSTSELEEALDRLDRFVRSL